MHQEGSTLEHGQKVWFIRPKLHRFSHERNGISYAVCGAFAPIAEESTTRRRKKYGEKLRILTECEVCNREALR